VKAWEVFSYLFEFPDGDTLCQLAEVADDPLLDEELRSCVRKIVATDPGVLRSEYTGLFVSGFPSVPCPPYESFYCEGCLYGAATSELAEYYRSAGYEYINQARPADHLAVQLEFVAITGDTAVLERLRKWVPQFAEVVAERSQRYGAAAKLLSRALAHGFRDEKTSGKIT